MKNYKKSAPTKGEDTKTKTIIAETNAKINPNDPSVVVGLGAFCDLYAAKVRLDLVQKLIRAEVAKDGCKFINIENVWNVLQNF